MKIKETYKETIEEFLYRCVEFYKPILGLQLYNISVEKDEKEEFLLINQIPYYLEATIFYSDKVIKCFEENKKDYLRYCILHELTHLLTNKLKSRALDRFTTSDCIDNENENLVETISVIINKLINK